MKYSNIVCIYGKVQSGNVAIGFKVDKTDRFS